jgi:hypothetical protein
MERRSLGLILIASSSLSGMQRTGTSFPATNNSEVRFLVRL